MCVLFFVVGLVGKDSMLYLVYSDSRFGEDVCYGMMSVMGLGSERTLTGFDGPCGTRRSSLLVSWMHGIIPSTSRSLERAKGIVPDSLLVCCMFRESRCGSQLYHAVIRVVVGV